ncbi:hypothetical protein THAOC_05620, partial [Thalassiosira oceanica]
NWMGSNLGPQNWDRSSGPQPVPNFWGPASTGPQPVPIFWDQSPQPVLKMRYCVWYRAIAKAEQTYLLLVHSRCHDNSLYCLSVDGGPRRSDGAKYTAIDVHAITSGVGSVRVGAHHTDVAVYAAAAGAAAPVRPRGRRFHIATSRPGRSVTSSNEAQQPDANNTTTPVDYSSLTVTNLKSILRDRGLKVSGRKADLVQRLEEYDALNQVGARGLGHDLAPVGTQWKEQKWGDS